ncbi:MAG: hypothetical protein J6M53_02630 [Bacteroidaceae bacterium]|nr:hypothetical protein [Bacteroidaceae bacterium]
MTKQNLFTARRMFLALLCATTSLSCSHEYDIQESDIDPEAAPAPMATPITVTAHHGIDADKTKSTMRDALANAQEYGSVQEAPRRVAYHHDGTTVKATFEQGDKLVVVYDGLASELAMVAGEGSDVAIFEGALNYYTPPTATSDLSFFIKDRNHPTGVSIGNNGAGYETTDGVFGGLMDQNGTLDDALSHNIYQGTAAYGTGEHIRVEFVYNVCILRLTVTATNGILPGSASSLVYSDGPTAMAKATFSADASLTNTVYLALPAGTYTGSGGQRILYSNETLKERVISLGSNASVTLAPGRIYTKALRYGMQFEDYIYSDGTWGTERPAGKTVVAYVITKANDGSEVSAREREEGYKGYAMSFQRYGPTSWDNQIVNPTIYSNTFSPDNSTYMDGAYLTDLLCALPTNRGNAAKAARAVTTIPGGMYSAWFLGTYKQYHNFFDQFANVTSRYQPDWGAAQFNAWMANEGDFVENVTKKKQNAMVTTFMAAYYGYSHSRPQNYSSYQKTQAGLSVVPLVAFK